MKKSKIKSIRAREIIDSRGNPTVEVDLETSLGVFQASVPSGASKGKYETWELRDGGKRYHGKGVLKAVRNVNEIISQKLKGRDATHQKEIDDSMRKLDGTKNKSKLGANAILAVSLAVCRAAATAESLPLYKYLARLADIDSINLTAVRNMLSRLKPCFNVINGGAHAGNDLDFQEFMIVPQIEDLKKSTGVEKFKFKESLRIAGEIYHELKNIIKEKYIDLPPRQNFWCGGLAVNVGDEGGFAPPVRTPEEALNLILTAAKNQGYRNKIKIILDAAASQFFVNGKYKMKIGTFTRGEFLNYYLKLIRKYPILGLEDPFSEDDWKGWQKILNLKSKILNLMIIGDDLLATNPERIKEAQKKKACNALILKPNQIGTISETIEAVKLAKSFGWKIIVSHRSGETNDDFIADLAVGVSADFIKAGAPARGERVAKYNRLLRIEEEIHSGS